MFYVYIYLDTRKSGSFQYGDLVFNHEPFYIGKGKGRRFSVHLRTKRESDLKLPRVRTVRAILKEGREPEIKIIPVSSEDEAFALEVELIKKIGRRDLKKGPLTNLSDGGDGSAGHLGTRARVDRGDHNFLLNHPMKNPETVKKVSDINSELWKKGVHSAKKFLESDANRSFHREKMLRNNPMKNPETAKKSSIMRKGIAPKHSAEVKAKIKAKASERMSSDKNPMKDPERVKRMLETRKANKLKRMQSEQC